MKLVDADKLTIDCYAQGQDGTVPAVTTEQIDEAPTVEERKHGHWVRFVDYEFDEYDEVGEACYRTIFRYKCSICNQGSYCKPNNHYCPNCGAIMDKKVLASEEKQMDDEIDDEEEQEDLNNLNK